MKLKRKPGACFLWYLFASAFIMCEKNDINLILVKEVVKLMPR